MKKDISIYIHIPFCIRKCRYCDFLSFQGTAEAMKEYHPLLLREMENEAARYREYEVKTIFIGGGTPSAVPPLFIQDIMHKLYRNYRIAPDAEISMEVNPGTASRESLILYRNAGINRLSIGLQSAEDTELKILGRIHTYSGFLDTYRWAVRAGFTNLNVDLMSALPGQTAESYERTLRKVLSLKPGPAHISAYSLIVEEGTPFFELQRQGRLNLPAEEAERDMYALTKAVLQAEGYNRYEISNYAREGFECRHNKVYWTRGNYAGFGLGASSMVENVRRHNETKLADYRKRVEEGKEPEEIQVLDRQEQMEEFMFLGLRLAEGVGTKAFAASFGVSVEEVYGEVLEKHRRNGLLHLGERIALTDKGMDVSNYVMADFLM